MDMERRAQLIEKIKQQGLPQPTGQGPYAVVSLEDFFEGNDDDGSIGCNLTPLLGPQFFYKTLREIRARPEVHEIFVAFHFLEKGDPSEPWPFSDTLFVVTSASREQLASWVEPLQPDEVSDVFHFNEAGRVMAPPGTKVYCVWWD